MYLGIIKQSKEVICFLLLTLSATVSAQTGDAFKYRFEDGVRANSVIPENNSLIINYSLSELNINDQNSDNGSFYRLSVPGHTYSSDPGKPEVPVLTRLLEIPEGAGVKIRITDIRSRRLNPSEENIKGILHPAQHGVTKQQEGRKPEFVIDKRIYATRGLIKSDTVRIEDLGKIRGRQISNIVISPVRYNPALNIIEVITSMKIHITFEDAISKGSTASSSGSQLFDGTLEKGILNYYPEDLINGFSEEPVGMIILTDTTFKDQLKPFYEWKTQKGFRLSVLYRGEGTTGSTYTELKDAVSREYNAGLSSGHAPEYLLIIGDITKIPYYGKDNITDMYYGEFDGGGDYLPEMYVGRIPAPDTNSVKSIIGKILQYEKFEFADTNKFYEKALAFAGKDPTYANYMNGQIRYAVSNYLTPANGIKEYHFFYPEGATKKDSVLTLISNGLSLVNYTGHGSQFGWLHIDIKSSDISKLGNSGMYPLVISNACRTAQYDDTTSFGNKMLLANNKGAIGFIGCSNDSYWDEDFIWAVGVGTPGSDPKYSETGLGAFDRLFHTHGEKPADWYITSGQINYAGNLAVSSSSSLKKKYYWETYTVLGDPSLIPYTGTPKHFNVALPDTLPNGIKSLSLILEPYSYAAASRAGLLFDASHASPSGSVTLELPGLSDDSCTIVITGQNRFPLIKTVYFSDINRPYLNLASSSIYDPNENNDGKADYGEDVSLNLKISNLGKKPSTSLTASISSDSPWISILTGNVYIGTLGAKSEIILQNNFRMRIAEDIPDMGIITINLALRDSQGEKSFKIDIRVHAPLLEIINCLIDDSASGNSNSVADPGEAFKLVFQVKNKGTSSTSGRISVSSNDDELEVLDESVKSGVLLSGEVIDIPVSVSLSEDARHGDYFSFSSSLDCSPYSAEKDFQFRVGRIRESFESSSFEVFPWINLSSRPWIITSASAYEGLFSARSGGITHNSNSNLILRTYFPEPDTLRFYYKVSSELNYDYFQFNLNGSEIIRRSGEVNWTRQSVPVAAGYNKMEWIYKKDNSVSQGSDGAWIDLIDFSGSARVNYIQKDLEVARIVTPVQKEIYGQEVITVRVLNIGTDTLYGFNLAYSINNKYPFIQNFKNKLAPYQDSVTVSFDKKADMDLSGLYEISVFGYDNIDDYRLNDTLRVKVENAEIEESVTIYPNPFTDQLNISVNSSVFRRARISLTNLSGKQVYVENRDLVEGENEIVINTEDVSPSVYVFHITAGNFSRAVPLIKLKR